MLCIMDNYSVNFPVSCLMPVPYPIRVQRYTHVNMNPASPGHPQDPDRGPSVHAGDS